MTTDYCPAKWGLTVYILRVDISVVSSQYHFHDLSMSIFCGERQRSLSVAGLQINVNVQAIEERGDDKILTNFAALSKNFSLIFVGFSAVFDVVQSSDIRGLAADRGTSNTNYST
ncbi:hypothetical protein LTR10_024152 [Elasticomyces elasticus]|uniref:Uncharacterized protein n=1 Tax=Exophiala sideris TaxID=1016849 RepID=A0ABR0IV11_9EURO|nr:hypothetical protein LTR10_024152 [Elasticomyces elasticus]KAK5020900.1 hypothetical protein LTS07_011365 [Exophiala sideris]KAK5023103.1 hypothetical protein LTR13_011334 [Exophiala sideris]KAK5048418.1 hypothetical protein LTR69_011380 [Exophiala sideris]KAK5176072.1 hypothetical protein LTR44_011377 [Eurotiomycetes sp. CCFEE 6388]